MHILGTYLYDGFTYMYLLVRSIFSSKKVIPKQSYLSGSRSSHDPCKKILEEIHVSIVLLQINIEDVVRYYIFYKMIRKYACIYLSLIYRMHLPNCLCNQYFHRKKVIPKTLCLINMI